MNSVEGIVEKRAEALNLLEILDGRMVQVLSIVLAYRDAFRSRPSESEALRRMEVGPASRPQPVLQIQQYGTTGTVVRKAKRAPTCPCPCLWKVGNWMSLLIIIEHFTLYTSLFFKHIPSSPAGCLSSCSPVGHELACNLTLYQLMYVDTFTSWDSARGSDYYIDSDMPPYVYSNGSVRDETGKAIQDKPACKSAARFLLIIV
jgi:hypothetical protein